MAPGPHQRYLDACALCFSSCNAHRRPNAPQKMMAMQLTDSGKKKMPEMWRCHGACVLCLWGTISWVRETMNTISCEYIKNMILSSERLHVAQTRPRHAAEPMPRRLHLMPTPSDQADRRLSEKCEQYQRFPRHRRLDPTLSKDGRGSRCHWLSRRFCCSAGLWLGSGWVLAGCVWKLLLRSLLGGEWGSW